MQTKNDIIKSIYRSEFGSKARVLQTAREQHKEAGINCADVDEWFAQNVAR